MYLLAWLYDQMAWSRRVIGPGRRTEGICKHIEKELAEIRQDPLDLEEWIDVAILALDGAWRTGAPAEEVVAMLRAKQQKNFARQWPVGAPEDEAVEHIRE